MRFQRLAAILAAAAMLSASHQVGFSVIAGVVQAEEATPTPDFDLAQLMQRPFTEEEARRALDAYSAISDKYKEQDLSAASEGGDFLGALKSAGLMQQVTADLAAHGFSTIESFTRILISVTLSGAFVEDGQDIAEISKQIKEMEDDPNMPAELKVATLGMLKAMLPLESNVEVMRKLMADEAYGVKLRKLLDPEKGAE